MHIYASHDQGESWDALAMVPGQYWSNLYVRDDDVYLLGTSSDGYAGEGSVAISRSTDSGVTWQRQVPVHLGMWTGQQLLHVGLHIEQICKVRSNSSKPEGSPACMQVIVPSPDAARGSYATGATPLLVANGRLWRGLELWATPHRSLAQPSHANTLTCTGDRHQVSQQQQHRL